MARAFCATVSALLLVACGPIGSGDASPPNPPTTALAAWNDFPAATSPRPVVWLSKNSPSGGFEGASKMAFFCNKLVLANDLRLPPDTPVSATARWLSGVTGSYPALSATAAYAAMTRPPIDPPGERCASVPPMTISAVRLGNYPFGTDRGTAQLSAWLFTAAGARGELAYPAIAPPAIWGDGMASNLGSTATVSGDDHTLTYRFFGSPNVAGPCGSDYVGAAAESKTAVAVAVKATPHSGGANGVACPAYAQTRTVTLQLASALAGRVAIDAKSHAVIVCPAGSSDVSLPGGAIARC